MEDIEVDVDVENAQENCKTGEENKTELSDNKVSSSKDKDGPNQRHRFLRLPLARVKTMMKKDPDCGIVSQDAVFLVTKATEMFIEFLAKESEKQLAIMGKRKTVMRKDVDTVINSCPQLCFLDGALD